MTKKLLLAAALLAALPALAAEEPPPPPKKPAEQTPPPPTDPAVPPPSEEAKAGRIGQSPFRIRTSRPNYAETEVARPITLQKEWAEFGLAYEFRETTQATDSEGNVEDVDYTYTYSWLKFETRYGFTRNMTMYLQIPYMAFTSMDAENEDENATTRGMGDVHFGLVWQVLNRETKSAMTSVALQLDTKQPSGNESPGGPGNRHIPTGTGTTNAGLKAIAKQRIGPAAATVYAGYTHKFSSVTMWARDADSPAGGLNGRFKPGDEITAGGSLLVQPITLVAVQGSADYISRQPASIGPTSEGLSPGDDVVAIKDSDFEALNAGVKVLIEPSVNWTFLLGAQVPVMSRNSGYFVRQEDLSQSYGTTIIGGATFRW